MQSSRTAGVGDSLHNARVTREMGDAFACARAGSSWQDRLTGDVPPLPQEVEAVLERESAESESKRAGEGPLLQAPAMTCTDMTCTDCARLGEATHTHLQARQVRHLCIGAHLPTQRGP
jgi:hypothetical protein